MSDGSTSKVVTIGDEDIRITRFRGLKGLLATALVSRVMEDIPDIQKKVDQYVRQFSEENKVVITQGMAKLPRYAVLGLSAEDFMNGPIEVPALPTPQQTMVSMAPLMMDLGRRELVRFLALIAIPNSDLEAADDEDNVEEALDRYGKRLFRMGDIDELLELAVVGWEVLREQILSKADRLGKLQSLPMIQSLLSMFQNPTSETETMDLEPEELDPPEAIQPIFPDEQPNSSTTSESNTDGLDEQPSTESPGSKSSNSSPSTPKPVAGQPSNL